jgi:hypothetical protein
MLNLSPVCIMRFFPSWLTICSDYVWDAWIRGGFLSLCFPQAFEWKVCKMRKSSLREPLGGDLCSEDAGQRFEESGLNPCRQCKEGEDFLCLELPCTAV